MLFKLKLKAATIIESLVAMVILVSIMGISSMIYFQLFSSGSLSEQFKASCIEKELISSIKSGNKFIDAQMKIDSWAVNCSFEKYPDHSDILQLTIRIQDESERVIHQHKELISDR